MLAALRQDEYDARLEALNDLVLEKLLAREFAGRSVTADVVLKDEVDAKFKKAMPGEGARSTRPTRRVSWAGRRQRSWPTSSRRYRSAAGRAQGRVPEGASRRGQAIKLEAPRFKLVFPASTWGVGPVGVPITLVAYSD